MSKFDTSSLVADHILQWLASNDTGESSKNIAFEYLGERMRVKSFAPLDPDDLGRCLRLIKAIPECRAAVDSLGKQYEKWAIAARHWDELAALMESEVGIDWSKGRFADRTYAAMQKVGL